jgi:ATP-dependent DNA helicase Rep
MLVLAGAGSGKTRVITEKIAHLIAERYCPAERIAAITFTNRAAREMQSRVAARVRGKAAEGLIVSTFHSLGLRILREDARAVGLKRNFSILDAQDSGGLLRDLMPAGTDAERLERARWRIGLWKNAGLDPETAAAEAVDDAAHRDAEVYRRYQDRLRAFNAVDFDDLIGLPVELLRASEDARLGWRERLRYLLVDEYQDTNARQYQFLKLLTGERAAFTAVGDDDQSIYGWRGAQPENLQALRHDFPNLRLVKLEQNYRSCGAVLDAANALISHNERPVAKHLWSALGPGDPPRVLACADERHEAERVVAEIQHLTFLRRAKPGDCAILYRGNHQSRAFEQVLREQNMAYHLSGGTAFFDRAEVKDLLCYLRLMTNPDDNSAFLRVINTPRRSLGAVTLERVARFADQQETSLFEASLAGSVLGSLAPQHADRLRHFTNLIIEYGDRGERGDPVAAVRDLVRAIDYESWLESQAKDPKAAERRLQNVADLIGWLERLYNAGDPNAGLSDLVGRLALMTSLDKDDDTNDHQVRLMTLHAAKGSEFPHVFLVGMEEGLLPHAQALAEDGLDEERRLAYVGITRAERTLTLTHAAKRRRYGEWQTREPSRFLDEIPDELVDREGSDAGEDRERSRSRGRESLAELRRMLAE